MNHSRSTSNPRPKPTRPPWPKLKLPRGPGNPLAPSYPVLPDAIHGARARILTSQYERLAYYAAAPAAAETGTPLVLIHSINAAPSSYEVKPLFERYRTRRPVYSLDLPGFGHSVRDAGPYRPERFAQAIGDFLHEVVGQPADVLALSLSSEFVARVALEAPERFRSLVLVSPTGFGRQTLPGLEFGRRVHGVLRTPVLSQGLFGLLTTRPSIRYYLGKSFLGAAPADAVDYAHATAHQPDAHHAPLTFLASLLFTRDALRTLYARLDTRPVLVIADRDPYIGFEHLGSFIATRPNWHWRSLAPHRGLPHWERPETTAEALDQFWAMAGDAAN